MLPKSCRVRQPEVEEWRRQNCQPRQTSEPSLWAREVIAPIRQQKKQPAEHDHKLQRAVAIESQRAGA